MRIKSERNHLEAKINRFLWNSFIDTQHTCSLFISKLSDSIIERDSYKYQLEDFDVKIFVDINKIILKIPIVYQIPFNCS